MGFWAFGALGLSLGFSGLGALVLGVYVGVSRKGENCLQPGVVGNPKP